ncbi:MAG TPA: cysteine desulfurase-like protein [Candidatus Limnocylindrales bacterium]|nr:cysteine desulfurase-like protein [Candidatus Limnocylindrales bacterium]
MPGAIVRPPSGPRAFEPDLIRPEFPALSLEVDGRPAVFLDGPGGTQVPQRTIDAIGRYYRESNANDGGAFLTSERSDAMVAEARAAVADFLGAASPREVKFGQNMTSLTFHVARSIGASLRPGDEVVVTVLDHEANVSPWQAVAADRDLVVRTVDIHPDDCTLDLDDLERQLGPRTRVVAVGYASNAVGTVNPIPAIVQRAHAVGALAYVDAVHYAPHGLIDVAALDVDLLVTSAYKWYGPHLGILYGKEAILDRLPAYKVRPAHDRFETGTQDFEAMAGVLGTLDYLQELGRRFGPASPGTGSSRRQELAAAFRVVTAHEERLVARLLSGLAAIEGLRIWGVTDSTSSTARTPTVALTVADRSPRELAAALGRAGIFVWDGDFYARALIERLGLLEAGGVVRLGLVHYNTMAEVDRVLGEIESLIAPR